MMSLPLVSRIKSRLKRFRRNDKGATAVEFALISIPFFGILFAIAETGVAFIGAGILDRAVEKASRSIMVGSLQATPGNNGAKRALFHTNMCTLLDGYLDCNQLKYDVQAYNTFGDLMAPIPMANGGLDTSVLPRFNPGTAGQVVIVRVYYEMPVYVDFFGSGLANLTGNKRLLVGAAAFKNEPFN